MYVHFIMLFYHQLFLFCIFSQLELKNKQLIEEKEILSAEVVKLQDLVDELRKGRETVLEGGRDGESSSIRHYQPNNPEALMKKIGTDALPDYDKT